jgi:hypothetical protein
VGDVGTDAQESFPSAAIFDGVLRFLDGRSVKFNGGDSRPGIEQLSWPDRDRARLQ